MNNVVKPEPEDKTSTGKTSETLLQTRQLGCNWLRIVNSDKHAHFYIIKQIYSYAHN